MRTASSGGERVVLPICRLLKSGERLREGDAWEVVFRAGAREDGLPAGSVRLALTWDGFSVGETAGQEETVSTFDWKDVECGIRRTYGWNADHRREEARERRGTCDLASCLAGLDLGLLASAACDVREFREYRVIRSVGELQGELSERLVENEHSCRLRTRDGGVDIWLTIRPGRHNDGQREVEVSLPNASVDGGYTYPSLSALLKAIPSGLYNRGLRLY